MHNTPPVHPPALEAFVAEARPRSELWRTLLGLAVFALIYAGMLFGGLAVAIYLGEMQGRGMGFRWVYELQAMRSGFATMVMLGALGLMIPALWVPLRFIHKRPLLGLLGPAHRVNWRLWGISAMVLVVLSAVDMAVSFWRSDPVMQMPPPLWAISVLPALALLFVQTTAEEFVFRGYLLQQLAARFRSRWVWMVLPALGFGALHWDSGSFGDNAPLVVANAVLMGILAADLTARFGDLSASMGLHFANNAVIVLLLSPAGQLSGLALFTYEMDKTSTGTAISLVISMLAMVAIYGAFLAIWRRRR